MEYKKVGLRDGALFPTCRKGFLAWDGLLRPLGDLPGLQAILLLGLIARRGSFIGKTLLAAIVCCPGCYGAVSWVVSQGGVSSVLWVLAIQSQSQGMRQVLTVKDGNGSTSGKGRA